jgi:hypothetical protein
MKKIVIIGDSFCRTYMHVNSKTRPNEKSCFWVDELKSHLNNEFEIVLDAQPSRDAKTILENWIKILPQLSENDFVVVCFPSLNRTRLPFHKSNYEYLKSSDGRINVINRFYGTASYDNSYQHLEYWGNEHNWKHFEENLKYQEMINGSVANELNFLELIESVSKLTKCGKYVFTWDEFGETSNYIRNKYDVKKDVGIFESFNDVFLETNGECGLTDFHWSFKMNEIFGKFILEKIKVNE